MTEQDVEQQKDIGKLWGEVRELRAWAEGRFREDAVIMTGATGENGLRGNIRKLEEKMDVVEHQLQAGIEWGHKIWEVERHKPGNCIGKLAVDKLEERLAKDSDSREREVIEMRKARYTMMTGLGVALVASAGPIIMEIIKK